MTCCKQKYLYALGVVSVVLIGVGIVGRALDSRLQPPADPAVATPGPVTPKGEAER